MSRRSVILLVAMALVIGFCIGVKYQKFLYSDACLDLGGTLDHARSGLCKLP